MTSLSRERWRAERLRSLDREVEMLRAERLRLERLLADALVYGAHHTGVSWESLLAVLALTRGIRLERPAWIEERESRAA